MDNQPMHLTAKDLIVASIPTVTSTALGAVNQVIGILGGLIGIAYLIWKWRNECRKDG